mmetsp:Transcript_25648/g.59587  ORF Transcript_25648/g.59587 Transcript_25648/m.59587 type:complete len:126 (-) Transcript_25648:158-535(-)
MNKARKNVTSKKATTGSYVSLILKGFLGSMHYACVTFHGIDVSGVARFLLVGGCYFDWCSGRWNARGHPVFLERLAVHLQKVVHWSTFLPCHLGVIVCLDVNMGRYFLFRIPLPLWHMHNDIYVC